MCRCCCSYLFWYNAVLKALPEVAISVDAARRHHSEQPWTVHAAAAVCVGWRVLAAAVAPGVAFGVMGGPYRKL